MSKDYTFHNEVLKDLNELGILYSQNFAEGLEDISRNAKGLIRFIRSKNKQLAREIVSAITSCKYENNVLTFIIFSLCEDKRVVINGEQLTFREFVEALKKYGKQHRAIYAFMEDLGISRTYAVLNIEPSLSSDAYFIEKNIDDSFTLEYLTTYYEFDYVESLQSFISNVFIYDEERFRRTLKIVKNDRFQLLLAHKTGFKEVYRMRSEAMPVFSAVKLLRCEFEEQDLLRLISDTFFWWLLDNFDKYTYKKEAKPLYKELKKIKKNKMKLDKVFDFNSYVDMAARLYEIYTEVVRLSGQGRITVKKKLDLEQYTLDKAYCQTYICADYMKNNTVKLPTEALEEEIVSETKPVPEEDTQPQVFEAPSSRLSDKTVKRQERLANKLKRYTIMTILFSVLFLAIVGTAELLKTMDSVDFTIPENIISSLELYAFLGALPITVIACVILRIRVNKTQQALDNVLLIQNSAASTAPLKEEQLKNIRRIKENEEMYRRKAVRSHRVLSCIISVLLGFISGIAAIFVISLIHGRFELPIAWDKAYLNHSLKWLYLLIGPVVGLIYGLIRKRKGAWTAVLSVLFTVAGILILAAVLQ